MLDFGCRHKIAKAKRGAIVVEPVKGTGDIFDLPSPQLKKLGQGVIWRDEHFDGMALNNIARREKCSEAYVSKAIFGSFEILQKRLRYFGSIIARCLN